MGERGCAWDEQDVGRALEQPGERDLHGCCFQRCGYGIQLRRLQWRESAEREEGHVGNALLREVVEEGVICAMGDVVEVLHADDLGDGLRLRELLGSDVAETEMTNEALTFEI